MGLLDDTTQINYYQGNDYGNYQFVSLEDIINQFLIAYIGEEKIIGKASRTDVAFYAQRALRELSFDVFKSTKSQEIVLPPSLTMILPHDYVNYTRVLWSDSDGIKHPIYPTKHTQNPFKIKQDENGIYDFSAADGNLALPNSDFETVLNELQDWSYSDISGNHAADNYIKSEGGVLKFRQAAEEFTTGGQTHYSTRHYAVWQRIKVNDVDVMSLSAKGLSSAATTQKNAGIVRVGLSTAITLDQNPPQTTGSSYNSTTGYDPNRSNPHLSQKPSFNLDINVYNLFNTQGDRGVITFDSGDDTLSTTAISINDIDVSEIPLDNNGDKWVYVLIVSDGGVTGSGGATSNNQVDDITLTYDVVNTSLTQNGESTTWTNYKNATPAENQDSYDDDYHADLLGNRYGIDPQHAQINGSFFIDDLKGLIHFSSNISGKTVILDYISDSLGTDAEMKVHKFAEDAMYKWIMHAILSTRANTPEYIVRRYQKEKFAAVRQAKLRLSNIKLEEITQILRGKSKWIKH